MAAALLRVVTLGRDNLWFDEIYNVWISRFPLGDMLQENISAGHPPLYYLAARAWFGISQDEFWVRLLSALFGIALVWLMYLLGRELSSRCAGLWAAALAAVSPLLIWHSRAATFYSLLMTLTVLTLLFLARAARRGGFGNWAGFFASMTAVYLTTFFAAVLQLACFSAYWLLEGKRPRQRKTFIRLQVPLAAMALISWLVSSYSVTEETYSLRIPPLSSYYLLAKRIVTAPLVLLAGDPMQNISIGTNWFSSWMVGAPARPLVQGLALLLAAALAVLLFRFGPAKLVRGNIGAMLAVSAILTVVTLFLVFISDEQLTSRFYAWAVPSSLIVVALLVAAAPRGWRLTAGGTVMATTLALAFWGTWLFPATQGYVSDVGELLQEGYREGDLVYGFPLHDMTVIEAYYLPDAPAPQGGFPGFLGEMYFMPAGETWTGYRSGYWIGTGKTQPIAGDELAARVEADTGASGRVWLVMPESFREDYPEIVLTMERGKELRGEWIFSPMVVMLYEQ